MKLDFNLKTIATRLKSNISLTLLLALVLLVLVEARTVKQALQPIAKSKEEPPILQARLSRVNFKTYDELVRNRDEAKTYVPSPLPYKSPFGLKPADEAAAVQNLPKTPVQ
jgi:hypothetical protein